MTNDTSERKTTGSRGRMIATTGILLFTGGLVALGLPVTLGESDSFGIEIGCGTGYHSGLLQATVADENSARRGEHTDYVGQCENALAFRRVGSAVPIGVGAALLAPATVLWVRTQPSRSGAPGLLPWFSPPNREADLRHAEQLDRRSAPYRGRPKGTTL